MWAGRSCRGSRSTPFWDSPYDEWWNRFHQAPEDTSGSSLRPCQLPVVALRSLESGASSSHLPAISGSNFRDGALLVAAYAERCSQFWEGTKGAVKRLTGWISGYESNTHLTRSLLGLQPLPDRLASLKTLFANHHPLLSR